MKVTKLIMLLFISLFLISCEKSVEYELGPMGSIRGYVYINKQLERQTGECFLGEYPYVNARVRLLGTDISTRTDNDGYFTLERVPEGTFSFTIDPPIGYYRNNYDVTMYNENDNHNYFSKIVVKWGGLCETCPE